jgi:hypothetical protein
MFNQISVTPRSWLAFELNILRRLKFSTAALPFTPDAGLGTYLKRWNVAVAANDHTRAGWTKCVASIQNNSETVSDQDVAKVLEDAYVPRYRLQNPALRNWFNETDSWWFDNVRQNIEQLPSTVCQSIAATIAMQVGDYVFSFDDKTLELRQPLSHVFRRLWSAMPDPVDNGQKNVCSNRSAYEFIAETGADLMFLRLPRTHNMSQRNVLGWTAWREEWLRGGNDFWAELERGQANRLGTLVETKSQYLTLLEETLRTASHIQNWALAHVEDGVISTQDIVETIGRIRRVDTIFTKDFSEVTGTKAVIVTA